MVLLNSYLKKKKRGSTTQVLAFPVPEDLSDRQPAWLLVFVSTTPIPAIRDSWNPFFLPPPSTIPLPPSSPFISGVFLFPLTTWIQISTLYNPLFPFL